MGLDQLDRQFEVALSIMETTVNMLAAQVPQPQFITAKRSFRYREKSIHQAIVQKIARMVSTLHSARLLLEHGFVQEVCVLQRVLGEFQSDVLFLIIGIQNPTDLHKRYLESFYQEEFDTEDPLQSTHKRPSIPRRKIDAMIVKFLKSVQGLELDQSTVSHSFIAVHKTYSGYVHGASPQIMDMYRGFPSMYHMKGMRETPLFQTHREDLTNYFIRGLFTVAMSAVAFGMPREWSAELMRYATWFCNTFESQK